MNTTQEFLSDLQIASAAEYFAPEIIVECCANEQVEELRSLIRDNDPSVTPISFLDDNMAYQILMKYVSAGALAIQEKT